jgi:hypothetical protein
LAAAVVRLEDAISGAVLLLMPAFCWLEAAHENAHRQLFCHEYNP